MSIVHKIYHAHCSSCGKGPRTVAQIQEGNSTAVCFVCAAFILADLRLASPMKKATTPTTEYPSRFPQSE